jgi:hypothetical protein
MRIAWRTVGSIITRDSAELDQIDGRLDGLRRTGIAEISVEPEKRRSTAAQIP